MISFRKTYGMKPSPVPPASGPMNGAHRPCLLDLRLQRAEQLLGGVVLLVERRLVRIDVRVHERAHLLAAVGRRGIRRQRGHGRPDPSIGLPSRRIDPWTALRSRTRSTPPAGRVADLARGLGGARRASCSSPGRSATSRAAPARRRRCARTSRRSSGGGCGRGCSPGNVERDLSVEVLGTRSPVPFLLAPIGVLSIAHPDAELARRARGRVDGRADDPLERRVELDRGRRRGARARRPRWFQLYWVSDRELAGSFVDRAGAAGYGAIVVTLDTLILGWRAARPAARLPAVPAGRGARAVLQRPGLPRAARRAARGGRAHGVRAARSRSSRTSA